METTIEQRYEEAARLLKILGHPVRLAMVASLREKSWCVCELAAALGLNKSAASKHLSLLKSVGVIDMDRDGTRVNCTLVMSCVFDMMRCANPLAFQTISSDHTSSDSCDSGCCTTKEE